MEVSIGIFELENEQLAKKKVISIEIVREVKLRIF